VDVLSRIVLSYHNDEMVQKNGILRQDKGTEIEFLKGFNTFHSLSPCDEISLQN